MGNKLNLDKWINPPFDAMVSLGNFLWIKLILPFTELLVLFYLFTLIIILISGTAWILGFINQNMIYDFLRKIK
jgi:uncharacterized metal-binding protein